MWVLLGSILAVAGLLAVGGSKLSRKRDEFKILVLGATGVGLTAIGLVMMAKNHL